MARIARARVVAQASSSSAARGRLGPPAAAHKKSSEPADDDHDRAADARDVHDPLGAAARRSTRASAIDVAQQIPPSAFQNRKIGHDIRFDARQPRGRDPQPGDPASEEHAPSARGARRTARRRRSPAAVALERPGSEQQLAPDLAADREPTLSPTIAATAATTITSSISGGRSTRGRRR